MKIDHRGTEAQRHREGIRRIFGFPFFSVPLVRQAKPGRSSRVNPPYSPDGLMKAGLRRI